MKTFTIAKAMIFLTLLGWDSLDGVKSSLDGEKVHQVSPSGTVKCVGFNS